MIKIASGVEQFEYEDLPSEPSSWGAAILDYLLSLYPFLDNFNRSVIAVRIDEDTLSGLFDVVISQGNTQIQIPIVVREGKILEPIAMYARNRFMAITRDNVLEVLATQPTFVVSDASEGTQGAGRYGGWNVRVERIGGAR